MENIKKYKDIFTEQFLNFFGDNKDLISEIELQSDEYSIDVDKIIEKLGISVEGTFFDTHSGQYLIMGVSQIENKFLLETLKKEQRISLRQNY